MKLPTKLSDIVSLFPKPPVHSEGEEKERERKNVSRYAQGNISLQLGKYITTKEIEQRNANLSSDTFLSKGRN